MANRQTLPVLPLRGTVIFPGVTQPIAAGRPGTLRAIEAALKGDRVDLPAGWSAVVIKAVPNGDKFALSLRVEGEGVLPVEPAHIGHGRLLQSVGGTGSAAGGSACNGAGWRITGGATGAGRGVVSATDSRSISALRAST